MHGFDFQFFEHAALNAFGHGADMRFGRRGAENEIITHRGDLGKVEPDDIFRLAVIGDLFAEFQQFFEFGIDFFGHDNPLVNDKVHGK